MSLPKTGRKSSIGATAVALIGSSVVPDVGCLIKAAAANTGKVYVGFSNAVTAGAADATDGFELSASESVFLDKSTIAAGTALTPDLANLYLIASASSQAVYFLSF